MNPKIDTDMYINNRFQSDVFASYAGPVIQKLLGPNPPDKETAAAWEAAVKLAKGRRANHNTSWRKKTKCCSARYGGTYNKPPLPPPPVVVATGSASDSSSGSGSDSEEEIPATPNNAAPKPATPKPNPKLAKLPPSPPPAKKTVINISSSSDNSNSSDSDTNVSDFFRLSEDDKDVTPPEQTPVAPAKPVAAPKLPEDDKDVTPTEQTPVAPAPPKTVAPATPVAEPKPMYCCDCSTELSESTCHPQKWGNSDIKYRCSTCWDAHINKKSPDNKDKTSTSKPTQTTNKTTKKTRTTKTPKPKPKTKPKRKSKPRKAKSKTKPDVPFKVGDVVQGKWSGDQNNGEWFPDTIISIDSVKRTIHMKYEDGDEDKSLPWGEVCIDG